MPAACTLNIRPFSASASAYSFVNVNIESYSTSPWMAEDGAIVNGVEIAVTGTCMISVSDWNQIRLGLLVNPTRLAYATMTTGGNSLIDLQSSTSSTGGPWIKISATEIIGTGVAMIRFELTDKSTVATLPAVSHVWTQKMSVDATGRLTRGVHGTLTCVRNSTASDSQPAVRGSAAWDATKPWADLFRRAILPDVPGAGWRRESQEFAYDALSNALVYQLIDKQYAYDLPDGVRAGDMEFTYERNAIDAGIGICKVSIDLEGDMNLMNLPSSMGSGNRRLIEAAVALSKARINANYKSCIITRMQITERNILSGFSIRFDLEAQVFPSSSTDSTVLAPLATMIGQRFQVRRNVADRTMDAYGAFTNILTDGNGDALLECGDPATAKSYYMVPHWISNVLCGMDNDGGNVALPYASLVSFTKANSYGDITVAVCKSADGLLAVNNQFKDGPHKEEMRQETNDQENPEGPVRVVSHSISTTKVRQDTGLVRLKSCYPGTADLVFQTRTPSVQVTERIEISQANKAPSKVFRPMPVGAVVLTEEWDVAFGRYDQQGTRLFTGVFLRTYMLLDYGSASTNGFTTQTTGGVLYRQWIAPNSTVLPAISPYATNGAQSIDKNPFEPFTDADNRYGTPSPEGYVR